MLNLRAAPMHQAGMSPAASLTRTGDDRPQIVEEFHLLGDILRMLAAELILRKNRRAFVTFDSRSQRPSQESA